MLVAATVTAIAAVPNREAVGNVVSMVLPRINTAGQPGLPLLPSIAQ